MMETNKTKVTFQGKPVTLVGREIRVGDHGPDFKALDNSLTPKTLDDFEGKVKILSVYPSIDTGVCSKQSHRFNKEADALSNDIVIINISNDLPFALGRFCGAEGITNLVTLSDHKDTDFGKKYGFLIDELRLLSRGVVVLDKENKVQYVEYVSEIGDEPDYDKAIEAAKKLV
ncbi:MAG: thiol peroxidase [Bacteroidales bacterium]|jgi:thiol peroxidase